MAGLQMPKKGQGAQLLRELQDKDRSSEPQPPESTEPEFRLDGRAEGLTELRTDGSTDTRTEGREDGMTAALPPAHEEAQPSRRPSPGRRSAVPAGASRTRPARPQTQPEAITDANFADVVREAIAAKRTLAGGNKTTVDMTPELAKRAALYSLDHAKVSTRQMFVELLDAFLTLEGY